MRILLGGLVAAQLSFAPVAGPAQPALQRLAGTVRNGTGADVRPVRRAKVTLTGPGLQVPRVADTDTDGAYRFDGVPANTLRIRVQKAGFVTLDAAAEPDAALTMTRGGAIEGIVSTPDGDPVWKVVVAAVQPTPAGAPKIVAQTRTDDLGRYRLHSLATGDYLVSASMDRLTLQTMSLTPGENGPSPTVAYHPAAPSIVEATPVRVMAGRDVNAIDIALTAVSLVKTSSAAAAPRPDAAGAGRIFGTVVDAVSGKPIARARILLLPAVGQGPRLTHWTRSDDNGRFEYTSLAAQRYTLRFTAPRFVSLEYGQKGHGESATEIQLRDAEEFRADMKLSPTSAIEGMLLDEFGDPAPNIAVVVAQRIYVAGRQRLIPGRVSIAPTDDRGQDDSKH
jgi:5-hydroxyisourate hydrolase-like protein (transthyretin family)